MYVHMLDITAFQALKGLVFGLENPKAATTQEDVSTACLHYSLTKKGFAFHGFPNSTNYQSSSFDCAKGQSDCKLTVKPTGKKDEVEYLEYLAEILGIVN